MLRQGRSHEDAFVEAELLVSVGEVSLDSLWSDDVRQSSLGYHLREQSRQATAPLGCCPEPAIITRFEFTRRSYPGPP